MKIYNWLNKKWKKREKKQGRKELWFAFNQNAHIYFQFRQTIL